MTKFYHFKKFLLLFVFTPLGYLSANAQAIRGNVSDAKTGEPLIGATVSIKGANVFTTIVKLDGTYQFKNAPVGSYQLQVKYIGYKTTKEYTIESVATKITVLNIAMVDNSTALSEVSITEHAGTENDNSARNSEKVANNTMNVVSASAIAISPDVIVSNVLARVPGISVDRSNTGDGQHVIIRGMDKKYNTTLVNGIKIPSPDNKNRFVPLDVFPADLVARIEVSKTLTPDMEADASGGVVNLIMKTAPDQLRVEGSFGTGYSQLFFDRPFTSFDHSGVSSKAPGESLPPLALASIASFPYNNLVTTTGNPPPTFNASLTIGNRFLNKKFGVLFSGTFQNSYVGNNSFFIPQVTDPGPALTPGSQMVNTAFQDEYIRQYSSNQQRAGVISSFDYNIDKNNTITLLGTFISLDEYRVRQTADYALAGYSYNGYQGTNGIDNLTETRSDLQKIYSGIIKGEHKVTPAFKVNWTFSTSEATHNLPDVAEFDIKQKTNVTTGGTYAPTPGGGPADYTYITPAVIDSPKVVGNESRLWRHNTDKDISAYIDLKYDTKIFGHKTIFGVGGMFRHKNRDNFNDSYTLTPVPDNSLITGSDEKYVSVPASQFFFNGTAGRGSSYSDAGVYTFYENVQSGYGEIKYFFNDRFNVIFGLRAESTLQSFTSSGNPALGGNYGRISYVDYLPSINFKYDLTDVQALRLSYYESIYRPTASDIIPFVDGLPDGQSTTGNPNLQHTVVNNYDLRYEAFPGALDEFMIGPFYKYLINPIEFQAQKNNTIEPTNLGDAHNFGIELVAKKFFGNIGISGNYTYTNSQITSTKYYQVTGSPRVEVDQTRPLQGQSANVGNFSLLYKNTKNGLDAQLAVAYTGERINAVSYFKDLDIWEKATVALDFSAQKEFKKRYVFYVKVNNILNTPYELFIKQNNATRYSGIISYYYQQSPNYTTVEYDKYYARYSFGFRFKL